jgi:hypothetical protein
MFLAPEIDDRGAPPMHRRRPDICLTDSRGLSAWFAVISAAESVCDAEKRRLIIHVLLCWLCTEYVYSFALFISSNRRIQRKSLGIIFSAADLSPVCFDCAHLLNHAEENSPCKSLSICGFYVERSKPLWPPTEGFPRILMPVSSHSSFYFP